MKLHFSIIHRLALLALVLCPLLLRAQVTQTIEGPELTSNEGGHDNSGIAFDSLDFVRLLGFDFHNQGAADQVLLVQGATVLHALDVPASNQIYSAVVDWLIEPGMGYYLVGTTTGNGRFSFVTGIYPVANSHIRVTSGIFSSSPMSTAWGSFRNITTTLADDVSNPIPEPSTFLFAGLALSALLGLQRRRA